MANASCGPPIGGVMTVVYDSPRNLDGTSVGSPENQRPYGSQTFATNTTARPSQNAAVTSHGKLTLEYAGTNTNMQAKHTATTVTWCFLTATAATLEVEP